MAGEEQALNAQLARYQGLSDSFAEQGLVEIFADWRTRADAAAFVASHSDSTLRRIILAGAASISLQAKEILIAFTPWATGQMARSTASFVQDMGTAGIAVQLSQDRMNTQQTVQVPPLVIGGHATRGGGGWVEANPYNVRAQPYIEEMATAELVTQGDLLSAAVMEGWTEYATRLERVYPPGGASL